MKVLVNQQEHFTHDYNIIHGKIVEMYRSDGGEWSEHAKGELVATLKDTGNNVKINIAGKKLKLDYHELMELAILLQATQSYHVKFEK